MIDEGEKSGGRDWPRTQMENFRTTLDECGLPDMGFIGLQFTWCNKWEGPKMIQERIDRCVCDFSWQSLFSETVVEHFEYWRSDHRPILLHVHQVHSIVNNGSVSSARRFYIEECWANLEECADIVANSFSATGSQQGMNELI
ncbi:hypothetical protein Dsin_001999 [Dipteronia sinensis]|uniref:Reverse transcriptase n=1 Tax=Dipteronia sinensis TaxID=43782 RepID=A0AAE0B5U2_9ROSI|nr:hypothetical protein Dsin_001999 [Dipteronia sinensis]